MAAALFDEPFDHELIRILLSGVSRESEKFFATAIIVCGLQDRWDAILEQTCRLLSEWQKSGEDDRCIYNVLASLCLRASGHRNPGESRNRFRTFAQIDIQRLNATVIEIIETKPRWYPLVLPYNTAERERERKWHGMR